MAARSTSRPTTPGAVIAMWLFDAVGVLLIGFIAAMVIGLATMDLGDAPDLVGASIAGGGLAAGGLTVLCLAANLRRGRAWAWVVHLVLLCVVTALAMPFSLVWLPLLVAWCGPGVRDWFDPPMRREFGRDLRYGEPLR